MNQETTGKHTPTPWKVIKNKSSWMSKSATEHAKKYPFDIEGEMFRPCSVYSDGKLNRGTAKANAQFITLACNHHEELVECLRDVSNAASYINDANRAGIEINSQDWSVLHDRAQRAKTILSKIKGTK